METTPYKMPPFVSEPAETYHAKRPLYLTSHQAIEFRDCPRTYRQQKSGLMARRIPAEAALIGRGTHTLTLEGNDAFEKEYMVGGPINPKTQKPYGSETKAFEQWAAQQTRTVLSDEQYALIASMAVSVKTHDEAKRLLANGLAEGVLRTIYCGVSCQIRADWFNPSFGLVDLKTCDNLDDFRADAKRFRYVAQMAFYRAIIEQVTGQRVPVYLIAVEKRAPYRVGVFKIREHGNRKRPGLVDEQVANEAAIQELRRCTQDNYWPTRYEAVRTL